jgi:dihydroorotate dehydrogenase
MPDLFRLFRPLIHALPPETVHNLGLWALRHGVVPETAPVISPLLQTRLLGLDFANPVGLAAGFDKNAMAITALLKQGFGFVEAGTVTPRPQEGNPKPRIFRLPEDEAVINRLGFNNKGLEAYIHQFRQRDKVRGVAGANIGKNKNSDDAIADYVTGLNAVYPFADYVTVNISSPNTQGLRALQEKQALADLLSALKDARFACAMTHKRQVPLWLKVAPDLTPSDREDIAEAVTAYGVDALMVSNTTISRPDTLKSVQRNQQGGLSGKPLYGLANENLSAFYRLLGTTVPLIGVGGISSAEDAYLKIRSGASLVQLYTALVYQGFGLVSRINQGLVVLLQRDGFQHISDAVGVDIT